MGMVRVVVAEGRVVVALSVRAGPAGVCALQQLQHCVKIYKNKQSKTNA